MALDFVVAMPFEAVPICHHLSASLVHHHAPVLSNVAGQRPPGPVAGFELEVFGRKHVAALKAETGPRAGQIDTIMGIDLAHAATRVLSKNPTQSMAVPTR